MRVIRQDRPARRRPRRCNNPVVAAETAIDRTVPDFVRGPAGNVEADRRLGKKIGVQDVGRDAARIEACRNPGLPGRLQGLPVRRRLQVGAADDQRPPDFAIDIGPQAVAANKHRILGAPLCRPVLQQREFGRQQARLPLGQVDIGINTGGERRITSYNVCYTKLLRMEESLSVDLSQTNVMKMNVSRLTRLVRQILEFRKAESGNLKLKTSYGDLAMFVRAICKNNFQPVSYNVA